MPNYEFECQECNTRFTRNLKMAEHAIHPCPKCEAEAPRLWEGFGGHKFESNGSSAVANTGVHTEDYPTADRAVGRSADDRREVMEARDKVKNEVRGKAGTHALIRTQGEGYTEYTPMTDKGREARRKTAWEALDTLKAAKEQPSR
jgi:putative FmdB family regulatory protein